MSPVLTSGFFATEAPGKPLNKALCPKCCRKILKGAPGPPKVEKEHRKRMSDWERDHKRPQNQRLQLRFGGRRGERIPAEELGPALLWFQRLFLATDSIIKECCSCRTLKDR